MFRVINQDITEHKKYTGKTVITLAIVKWLMDDATHSGELLVEILKKLCRRHLKAGFDEGIKKWILSNEEKSDCISFDKECFCSIGLYAISLDELNTLTEVATSILGISKDEVAVINEYVCEVFHNKTHYQKEDALQTRLDKSLPADLRVIIDQFEKSTNIQKPTYNSYKVTDWLWAGEYPGDRNDDIAKEKLRQFKAFGITHFIDLTEEGELRAYKPLLGDDMHHLRFPIRDQYIPKDTNSVRQLLDEIVEIHNEDENAKFYIHCWGGVGRTGTIVGCFLGYYNKLNADDAIKELARLFEDCPKSVSRISPENSDQFEFIRKFIRNEKMICE